jgi:osmotically-inducible protein OsmY
MKATVVVDHAGLEGNSIMQTTIVKTDIEVKSDVLSELNYEPTVKVTDIGVLVNQGAVTLIGYVGSYGEKVDAVRACKRVSGVLAIADEIEVRIVAGSSHSDSEIAASAAHQISACLLIPAGLVQLTVRDGWITAEGQVEWWYQKNAVENVLKYVIGMKGLNNWMTIKPVVTPVDVEVSITSALSRLALLDAKKIKVETNAGQVVLRGSVRTYAERDEAERAAWAAAGVIKVENHIKVEFWGFGN